MDFKTVDQNSMLIVYRQQSTSSDRVELWVYRDAKEGLYPYSRVLLDVNTSQNNELYWTIDPDQVKDEKEFYNYLTKARQDDIASGNSIARTKRSSKLSVKLEKRQYLHIDDMIKKSNQSGK
ncbi:hypothetical protein B7494_g5087 [Chlorociboria aeruginascens]|nr:hypothetical protein B7494_g5087 [Chlorociboria aeruginascens]